MATTKKSKSKGLPSQVRTWNPCPNISSWAFGLVNTSNARAAFVVKHENGQHALEIVMKQPGATLSDPKASRFRRMPGGKVVELEVYRRTTAVTDLTEDGWLLDDEGNEYDLLRKHGSAVSLRYYADGSVSEIPAAWGEVCIDFDQIVGNAQEVGEIDGDSFTLAFWLKPKNSDFMATPLQVRKDGAGLGAVWLLYGSVSFTAYGAFDDGEYLFHVYVPGPANPDTRAIRVNTDFSIAYVESGTPLSETGPHIREMSYTQRQIIKAAI